MRALLFILLLVSASLTQAATPAGPREPRSWAYAKIIPATGITIGQYEWTRLDIQEVERAADLHMAWHAPLWGSWANGYVRPQCTGG